LLLLYLLIILILNCFLLMSPPGLGQTRTEDHNLVLDLKDVRLVDRDAVRFLVACETDGLRLQNCSAYIREWIVREGDGNRAKR
jgi:hypothetical protein